MKKSSLIITGIVLTLTFTGCTKGSSTTDVGNKVSETAFTSAETRYGAEQATTEESVTEELTTEEPGTEELTTENPTSEEPTIPEQETEYNAESAKKAFEESDIPESIKSIFLSDGEFIDTMTKTEMKLSDYKLYDIIYSYDEHDRLDSKTYDMDNWREVFVWQSYIAVDFDDDGKKELFYAVNNGFDGVIFREHSDGKVYAYRHKSLRVHIGENGDVIGSGGADLTAHSLIRYSFDTERLISTKIAYAKKQEDGGYKYYGEGREISLSEFESYMRLLSEGSLPWCFFEITPDSLENQTSGN